MIFIHDKVVKKQTKHINESMIELLKRNDFLWVFLSFFCYVMAK